MYELPFVCVYRVFGYHNIAQALTNKLQKHLILDFNPNW